jgi:iron-sulfur cluster repair protein YtfE (RIC family)
MKRHQALEPFSRDHYGGLVVARHLKEKPGPEATAELLLVWGSEMEDHFREEELLLLPLATPVMGARLRREHEEIRAEVDVAKLHGLSESKSVKLGELIHDHIRWEERELFPTLEAGGQIDGIAESTEAMEHRRHESGLHSRRAELVNRRNKADR